MKNKYHHIATILCNHSYFKKGLFKSLDFTIADESLKLMKDLGIVLKQFAGGFYLLSSNPELLASDNKEHSLKIYLNCKDHYYINYTNLLSYVPAEDIFYFNNINAIVPQNSNVRALHIEQYVGENNKIAISNGNIKIPEFDIAKNYMFKDASGGLVLRDNVQESTRYPGEIRITNISEGLVQIFSNDEVAHEVYYYPNAVRKKPLGIMELFTSVLFDHFEGGGKVNYELTFNIRHTFWKYFLRGSAYQRFNDLSVIHKNEGNRFSSFKKQQIDQNTGAIVFESKEALPLLEDSEVIFQLVNNYDADLRSGRVLIKNLRHALPEQLYKELPPNNEHDFSHIYIN